MEVFFKKHFMIKVQVLMIYNFDLGSAEFTSGRLFFRHDAEGYASGSGNVNNVYTCALLMVNCFEKGTDTKIFFHAFL